MQITLTAGQIIAFCSAIITISGAVTVILTWINKSKEPDRIQNERLTEIEKRVARHDELLAKDNRRIENLEEGTRVTQRAILALLSHGIDGNNVEDMKKSKKELSDYLIGRA